MNSWSTCYHSRVCMGGVVKHSRDSAVSIDEGSQSGTLAVIISLYMQIAVCILCMTSPTTTSGVKTISLQNFSTICCTLARHSEQAMPQKHYISSSAVSTRIRAPSVWRTQPGTRLGLYLAHPQGLSRARACFSAVSAPDEGARYS